MQIKDSFPYYDYVRRVITTTARSIRIRSASDAAPSLFDITSLRRILNVLSMYFFGTYKRH